MTIGIKPVETTAPTARQHLLCPYIGLRRDLSVVARYPTDSHVCVSPKKKHQPPLEHQVTYCLAAGYAECPFFVETGPNHRLGRASTSSRRTRRPSFRLAGIGLITLLIGAMVALVGVRPQDNWPWFNEASVTTPVPAPIITPEPTFTPAPTLSAASAAVVYLPTVTPTPSPDDAQARGITDVDSTERFVTPTPELGGEAHSLIPKDNQVGWWVSDNTQYRQIGDSFLYAGQYNGQTYVAAARFDMSQVARGASIRSATLRLTGLRSEGIAPDTLNRWLVQFIAEANLPNFTTADFLTVFSAPAAITLLPELQPSDLGVDTVNEWQLDENVRRWLGQQRLDGTTSFAIRIMASTNEDKALFGWDSGYGSESKGYAPALVLNVGPPPPTPPPLPTRAVLVATLTPLPGNVVTAVAQSATATADAALFGTPTPIPYDIATPTPFPENLATVQANAVAAGLPAVVLNTPVPANAGTATAVADYATAVALTTGTFTPAPTDYVTPVLLYPSPPAENVATAAAQVIAATAAAQQGLPTATVPWNGVYVVYAYATPTPGNAETAVAMIQEQNAAVVATGTPTPTPWNLVVITPVPPPTPTLIPIVIPADQIAPTPTPTPTVPVDAQELDQFRGKILFLSDRTGATQAWAIDPDTGVILALVRDIRLHELARKLYLADSPDGSEQAIVQEDGERNLQIKVYSNTYGTTRQITNFDNATSYDPAWSPRGDWIVFVGTALDGDEIYVVDPQGNSVRRLTYNAWEWDKHPSWSPDGSRIVFYSNRDTGHRQIWIMDADGSNQRNLSNDEFENWDPVWIR